MKPELTTELKAKFFAMYWGQKVLVTKGTYNYPTGSTIEVDSDYMKHFLSHHKMRTILILKPLDSLKGDDEAYALKDSFVTNINDSADMVGKTIFTYQRLISLGYALPWMEMSTDDLVQAGWIKLTDK